MCFTTDKAYIPSRELEYRAAGSWLFAHRPFGLAFEAAAARRTPTYTAVFFPSFYC